jgi:hypothetical protein
MRISYVGGDAGWGNNTVTFDVSTDFVVWPTVQPGDFALLAWNYQNTATPTTPTGFSQIDYQIQGSEGASVYGKVCTGSESGNIVLVNSTSIQNKQGAVLAVYRGTHKTSPVLAADFTEAGGSVTANTHAAPSETLNVSDCAVATFFAERASPSSTVVTPPSGYTTRQSNAGQLVGSGSSSIALADDGLATNRASGASVSPGNWVGNQSVFSGVWMAWTILLRPAEYEGWGVDL